MNPVRHAAATPGLPGGQRAEEAGGQLEGMREVGMRHGRQARQRGWPVAKDQGCAETSVSRMPG
jgi:hypothetical protein